MADTFSDEIKDKLLSRLMEGHTLRKACVDEGMPAPSTVCRWVKENPAFAEQYARAREVGYQLMADDLLEIADDGTNDTYEDDEGNEKVNQDVIQRSRLRVDTRKWLLSKALPKVYGEKITNEHTGPEGGPVEVKK
jgi:hypothetical protein